MFTSFSAQSQLTEKCMLLIVKTFSSFASKPQCYLLSCLEEVKEFTSMTCLDVFLDVSLPGYSKLVILPDIDQCSTGIALSSMLPSENTCYYASHPSGQSCGRYWHQIVLKLDTNKTSGKGLRYTLFLVAFAFFLKNIFYLAEIK